MSDSQAAAAEPVVETKPKQEPKRKPRKTPRYHVVLWNDDHHSYEYVIVMLRQLFGHPYEKGFELAERVDRHGKTVVLTTTLEHAELKRDQIHAFGPDKLIAGCQGSMSASIEKAD